MNKRIELVAAINALILVGENQEFDPGQILQRLETIELLGKLDYDDLLQALRFNAETVYAFTAEGALRDSGCRYNGLELFPCRATCLYSYCDMEEEDVVEMNRVLELWLLEDFSFALVASTEVYYQDGEYRTAYRVIRATDLEEIAQEMDLDVDEIVANLAKYAASHKEDGMPTYEL